MTGEITGTSSRGNAPPTGRTRKRASEACTFCRRRKIKCSTERPSCANCKTYGMTCSYEPIDETQSVRRSRKTRRLEHASDPGTTRPASQDPISDPTHDTTHDSSVPAAKARSRSKSVSRIVVSANGMSSYHGRTSALFEENSHDRPVTDRQPKMTEEWVEKGLVAEAARQRQMEEVNYRQGKLDFDGVDPELGMHLLSLHWNRQHHSFLATYRPAFMRDMACNGPYFSKLLLNAIYFGAAKFSPRDEVRREANDVRTAGWKFRERVRELLVGALDKSEITTIQALLVMTNSLFALGDERSAAWLYAGLAFRMIVDLGVHVDIADLANTRKFSDEDFEIRRRVFWAAFVIDKIQSLYQGRPATIKESDTLVPMKFLDTFEEFEHWSPFAYSAHSITMYPGSPSYSVSTFRCLCQLSVILSDILSSIYTERSFNQSPEDLSTMSDALHSKLEAWSVALPSHLQTDFKDASIALPPHVLSLHAMYNVLMILLHRPFVADGHLYNTSRAISVNSFISCATAASTIVKLLRVYDKNFSARRAPYLISYATYVAATIHVRIAARRGPGSEAYSNLKVCLAVFRENQETNWAVRRANAIVQNLMKKLGVPMPELDDLEIETSNREGSNHSSPDVAYGRTSGGQREASLRAFDIDDIIQSFAREQDGLPLQVQATNADEVDQTPNMFPYQPLSAMDAPDGFRQPLSSFPQTQNPNWPAHGAQHSLVDASISFDDLLYGFNGSALDSFPNLDWDAMGS